MDPIRKLLLLIDKHYKILITISLAIFVVMLGAIIVTKVSTGYIFYRDISLKGGYYISIPINGTVDITNLEEKLEAEFNLPFEIRIITDPVTRKPISMEIETEETANVTEILNFIKEYGISFNEKEVTISKFTSKYGKEFYNQLILAIVLASVITSIVIFWRLRLPVTSFAVIFSTIFDIVTTIGFLNLIKFPIADAGIAALLMIIGYAIDDNIIISAHFQRYRDKPFVERVYRASVTALTLTITTVTAVLVLYLVVQSKIVKQIAFILLISELFDELNTWLFNLPLYKLYLVMKQGTPEK